MESVEVRFGRGDKRRTLGWLVVGPDGFLHYEKNGVELELRGKLVQWDSPTEFHVNRLADAMASIL